MLKHKELTDIILKTYSEVYNELGKMVKSQNFTKSQMRYELNTSELPIGIYVVKIRSANNDVKTIKISKM